MHTLREKTKTKLQKIQPKNYINIKHHNTQNMHTNKCNSTNSIHFCHFYIHFCVYFE